MLFKNYMVKKYFTIFLFLSFTIAFAQSVSVNGRITASRTPVTEVMVTFIDNSDTTKQYTAFTNSQGYYSTSIITSIESDEKNIPTSFKLGQSYPNPFSSTTAIPYALDKESNVNVNIYDILGRVVRKFEIGMESVGSHNLFWNGKNNSGNLVSNGIYFYQFLVNGESQIKKMIFNKNGSNSFVIPRGNIFSENQSLTKLNNIKITDTTSFTILLKNTNNTTPLIVESKLENVFIRKDTLINFAVTSRPVAIVNLDSLHQIIRGFGASNILLWRPDMTNAEIETAFGTGDGRLGFNILRLMVEADSNRWGLYLSTAKKAQDMGALIIASPWHTPSNMTETVNSVSRVKHDMYADYAEHLNNYIKFMTSNGIDLYGISIQNEPDITDQWTSWTSAEIFDFMKNYADKIVGTRVMAPESFQFKETYLNPILNDSAACANTDIVCGHIYGGGIAKYPLAFEKGKEVWMTEYLINSPGSGANMDTSLTGAMATAKSINDCMLVNMNTYIWWYLVRYYGPICDGTYLRKGEVTKKGYVMSQYAKYIRPGFVRVESSTSPMNSTIMVSAYKDSESDKIVIVAINNSTAATEQNFRIRGVGEISLLIPITTSGSKNCESGTELTVTDGNFKYNMEPQSITTFITN
ncbi:MAG: T9SS type A sorting domain-containing protein [Ignavibacteriae bacterium]|nr:T9SS type A sorting domain-containing protein [Ignavibacteriota bacterium]